MYVDDLSTYSRRTHEACKLGATELATRKIQTVLEPKVELKLLGTQSTKGPTVQL